jgi:hypothetical protein
MKTADLFIIDTAINGVDFTWPLFVSDYQKHLRPYNTGAESSFSTHSKYTELLLRTLLSVNPTAAIIYLEVSNRLSVGYIKAIRRLPVEERTRGLLNMSCRANNFFPQEELVTKYYGVPHVSVSRALEPCASPQRTSWWITDFLCDDIHPSVLGHEVVGRLISHFLLQAHWGRVLNPWPGADGKLPSLPPMFSSQSENDMYQKSHPLHLRVCEAGFEKDVRYKASGWRLYEDVKNKPGLIASHAGEGPRCFPVPGAHGKAAYQPRRLAGLSSALFRAYGHLSHQCFSCQAAGRGRGRLQAWQRCDSACLTNCRHAVVKARVRDRDGGSQIRHA